MIIDDNIRKLTSNYLLKHLQKIGLTDSTISLSILFFILSGLDLIDSLNDLPDKTKKELINWIYNLQLEPENNENNSDKINGKFGFSCNKIENLNDKYDCSHLAMTYCALLSLIILGDDLSRVNRKAILKGLAEYQKTDGRFIQALTEQEDDLRVAYCAATICYILNDWSTINKENMVQFIKSCQSEECGFGLTPGCEAHSGATFCAIASLHLMDRLNETYNEHEQLDIIRWCLKRQARSGGFQGRPNKDPDTCYSFWVGATLQFLNAYHFVHDRFNGRFLVSTFDCKYGGFGKYPDVLPDILHTFFGLAASSVRVTNKKKKQKIENQMDENQAQEKEIKPIFSALIISSDAFEHLKHIHDNWNCS